MVTRTLGTGVRRRRRKTTGRGFLSGLAGVFPPGGLSMLKKVFVPVMKRGMLGMGRRRRVVRRKRGRGIFGDILGSIAPAAGTFFGGPLGGVIGGIGGKLFQRTGLGRRRRVGRPRVRRVGRPRVRRVARPRVRRVARRSGRGIFSTIKSLVSRAHNFAKTHKLVSRGLNHFGYRRAGTAASAFGYGARKRTTGRGPVRRMIRF